MNRHLLPLLTPAVTAVAPHAILLSAYVEAHGGNLAVLACVGPERAGTYPYEHIHTTFRPAGYDGQFDYAIVRPVRRQTASHHPAKRHLRIFYPLLCSAPTGGDPVALLVVMPLVNLIAIAGLAWLGSAAATRQGYSAWWASCCRWLWTRPCRRCAISPTRSRRVRGRPAGRLDVAPAVVGAAAVCRCRGLQPQTEHGHRRHRSRLCRLALPMADPRRA